METEEVHTISQEEEVPLDDLRQRRLDDTRKVIAYGFSCTFVLTIILSSVFVIVYNYLAIEVFKDDSMLVDPVTTIGTLVGLVGTPLGFILGYYFKGEDK